MCVPPSVRLNKSYAYIQNSLELWVYNWWYNEGLNLVSGLQLQWQSSSSSHKLISKILSMIIFRKYNFTPSSYRLSIT